MKRAKFGTKKVRDLRPSFTPFFPRKSETQENT